MKQGDVYWYAFRAPDKRRPVLILTRNSAISYLNNVILFLRLLSAVTKMGTLVQGGRPPFLRVLKRQFDLHLLKPRSKKNAEEGPLLEGAASEKTSCDGSFITHLPKFSNSGAGFNQGQYLLDLALVDNNIWNQPAATQSSLAAANGRVKGVSRYGSSLIFEVFVRFELPSCQGLAETSPKSTPSPISAEAVARSISARSMESKMAQRGLPVRITVSGLDNTVITIESAAFTRESVMRQAGNATYMAPFRKMRFKRVVFTNSTEEWGYDLK